MRSKSLQTVQDVYNYHLGQVSIFPYDLLFNLRALGLFELQKEGTMQK